MAVPPKTRRDRRFTMIGTELFEWEEWWKCSSAARYLWLAIYASPDSKTSVPGMIRASVRSLAESAHVPPDEVLHSMDELVDEVGLVEYDQERRIIRLTKLPNAIDAPGSGFVVKGWYSRFLTFPQCSIRDAHVGVLHGLAQHGNDHVRQFWDETFGTISVPVKRHRGRKKFDSDTSSPSQPSLFQQSGPGRALDTVTDRQTLATLPHGEGLDTLSRGYVSVSVEGICSPLFSGSEGAREIPGSAPPDGRLRLGTVPLNGLPFSVPELLGALARDSAGRFTPDPFDERLVDALCATIRACEAARVGVDDLHVVGRWFAAGGLEFRSDLGPVWAAKPGNLIDAVGQARQWLTSGTDKVTGSRKDSRRVEPAPASAFGSGRRRI
jgi:hypothetical protein